METGIGAHAFMRFLFLRKGGIDYRQKAKGISQTKGSREA